MFRIEKGQRGRVYPNLLDGKEYWSEQRFEMERKRVFDRSWVFAGTQSQFPKENDFSVLEFFDYNLIIGRYGGEIRAFENRCPHRSSAIHLTECGSRPLICPFHGWCFNARGEVAAIPNQKNLFNFEPKKKGDFGLKSFEVAILEDLIFVRLPQATRTLAEFLGPAGEALASLIKNWRCEWAPETVLNLANWKLIVEISIEAYHAPDNHPLSLGVHGQPPVSYHHFGFDRRGHQILNIGNSHERQMTSAATIMLIYPNTIVIQLDGKIVSMVSLLPRRPDLTVMKSFTFFERGREVPAGLYRSVARSLRVTNLEDQRICEGQQKVIRTHQRGQPLGAIERAVYEFQKAYRRSVSIFPWAPDRIRR